MVRVVVRNSSPSRSSSGSSGSNKGGGIRVTVVDKPKTSRQQTIETLQKEKEVQAVASQNKEGLTRTQYQRELAKRGVSVRELRRATAEARARYRGGDDVFPEVKNPVVQEVYGPTEQERVSEQLRPTREDFIRGNGLPKSSPDAWSVDIAPQRSTLDRIKDFPNKIVEKITGKKPNELFFQATGSQRTVVDKATPIVVASELAQVPLRITKGTGEMFGILAEGGSRKVLPEGVTVTMKGEPQRNMTIIEPQFGTITDESTRGMITRNITTRGRATRDVTIFDPKRIGQGVSAGTQLGTALVFPTAIAAGTFAEGMETALDTSKTKQERFLGSAEAALSAGFLGFRAGKWWSTPTKNVKVVRPQAEDVTTSVSTPKKTVNLRGKTRVQTITTSRTFGEIGDEVLITESTKGRELLGLKPLKQKRITPKQFEVTTVGSQVDNQPFFVEEFVQGKKATTILKVSPSQPKVVTANNYGKLSRVEKFTVRKLLERRTGVPVSDKSVVRLLRERNIVITESEVEALGRMSLEDKSLFFQPTKKGRQIKRILSAEESFFGDSEDALQVTSGLSVSKDVTKPLARATGKTPVSQRYSLNVGIKPSMPREAPNIFSRSGLALKPAKIKKTPITSTFPVQEAQQTPVSLGSVVRSRVKPRKIPRAEPVLVEPKLIETIAPSSFAGLGLYEQQTTLSSSRIKPSTSNKDFIKPVVIPKTSTSQTIETNTFQNIFVGDDVSSSSNTTQDPSSKQSSNIDSDLISESLQTSTTKKTERGKNPLKPKKTFPPLMKIPKTPVSERKTKATTIKKLQGYMAQVKDKGKWVTVSKKAQTRDEALRLAAKIADNTTGVSIRAKPTRMKPTKPKNTSTFNNPKFRDYSLSKGRPKPLMKNTYIEKKSFRIDTLGEKKKLSVLALLGKKRKVNYKRRR